MLLLGGAETWQNDIQADLHVAIAARSMRLGPESVPNAENGIRFTKSPLPVSWTLL